MNSITVSEWKAVFAAWENIMKANAEYLIQLDGVAGDSDLGLTMSDGFAAANQAAAAFDGTDIGMMIYYSGKAIMSSAPSSLGTLLGSGFLEAGKCLKGRECLAPDDFYLFFEAIEKSIMLRGHCAVGDKTFIDGLDPAVQTLKDNCVWAEGVQAGLQKAAEAARTGSENTKSLIARHGRMAVRGEQSIGMLDPGSVVAALLVEAFANTIS